jgi:hypothetical protein
MSLMDMSLLFDIVGPYIFYIYMGLIAGAGLIPIFVGIMTLLMPKPVLDKYFKPPYFKAGECAFLTGIYFGLVRTAMFMRVLGFPGSGKKRGMTEVYKLAPRWYIILSRIIVIYILGIMGLILFVGFIIGIYAMFYAK